MFAVSTHSCTFVLDFFSSDHSYLDILALESKYQELEKRVGALEKQNEKLREDNILMKSLHYCEE